MSKSQRMIVDVLFPRVRAKLLRLLFTTPVKQRYVRELAFMSGLNLHTVHDELRKLSTVGLVISWSNGYHRFYQPNREHPLCQELFRIVELSEKLPGVKHSKLHRPDRRVAKRPHPHKPPPMPKDLPIKWHLFPQRPDIDDFKRSSRQPQ
jgi:predicted transcriptional regulator